jgi:transcription elongation factor GreA
VTETRDDSVTWLTQETYDRLKAELDQLSGPGRADIAKKIEAAREEGDLSENGGYHAAKDEQGQIEARIITLQHILENARVGAPPRSHGVVGPGMTVTVRFVGDDEKVTFLLASREESGAPVDVYSPRSRSAPPSWARRRARRPPTRSRTAVPVPSRSSKPFPTRDLKMTAGVGGQLSAVNDRRQPAYVGRIRSMLAGEVAVPSCCTLAGPTR